jgi:hypothetical protein
LTNFTVRLVSNGLFGSPDTVIGRTLPTSVRKALGLLCAYVSR